MGVYRKKVDLAEISTASEAIGIEVAHTLANLTCPYFRSIGAMALAYLMFERTEQDEVDLDNANHALEAEKAHNPRTSIIRLMRDAETDESADAILATLPILQEQHKAELVGLAERIANLNMLPSHAGLNAMENAIMAGKRKNGASTTVKDLNNRVLSITFPRKGFFFRLAVTTPDTWALYTVDNGARTARHCVDNTDLPSGSDCASMSKARKVAAAWIDYHGDNGKIGVRQAFIEGFKDFNQGGVSNVKVLEMPADRWLSRAELGELPE